MPRCAPGWGPGQRGRGAPPRRRPRQNLDRLLGWVDDYLDTGGPFPERLHLIALSVEAYAGVLAQLESFSAAAAEEIARWPTTRDLGMTAETRRRLERVRQRDGRQPG